MEKKQGDVLKMSNEIKHFNPNHDNRGRFTYTRNSGKSYSKKVYGVSQDDIQRYYAGGNTY